MLSPSPGILKPLPDVETRREGQVTHAPNTAAAKRTRYKRMDDLRAVVFYLLMLSSHKHIGHTSKRLPKRNTAGYPHPRYWRGKGKEML